MNAPSPSVAIVGGGLAGVAAAIQFAERGWQVELFESRRMLGGRAGSFRDPQSGELVDHCQHVGMSCCTNWLDFCRRTGVDDGFREYSELTFYSHEGRGYRVRGNRLLPAPLHLAPSFLRLGYLSWSERLGVGKTLLRLGRYRCPPGATEPTIGEWLRQQSQSVRAMKRFWSIVLVSALSESLERISVSAARKVFVDGFMGARNAFHIHVPAAPLGDLYGDRMIKWLQQHQVRIHLQTPVAELEGDEQRVAAVRLAGGVRREFDAFVIAAAWRRVPELFPEPMRNVLPQLTSSLERIESSPITAVHLWFDRPIMNRPHAVLLDRLSQWVFFRGAVNDEPSEGDSSGGRGYYYQVVISASRDLEKRQREDIEREVVADLAAIWPAAGEAQVRKCRIVTQPDAVFSVTPESAAARPDQKTAISNLALAGDWTETGWPATMEGAVRSGYLAAETLLRAAGVDCRCLVDDLPVGWFCRRLLRLN